MRAVGIQVHMEDRRSMFYQNGSPNIISPRIKDEGKKLANVIFMGFADDESIDLDDNNRIVRLEGRDYTALLIDTPHTGDITDYQRPLDVVIQEMLSSLKTTHALKVENRTDDDFPTLSQFGYTKTELGNQKNGAKNESYWDVIQKLVSQAGLIAFIELDKLVISKPRNLYSGSKIYQFIYGQNLKRLTFKRKLGRQKGINVLLRSVNLANKTDPIIEVKIPKDATIDWCKEMGVNQADQIIEKFDTQGKPVEPPEIAPYLSFNVSNIADRDQLIKNGESLWEEIGRQQIEGTLETKEMVQLQDRGVEFDITKIRNGTPVSIEIGQGDVKGLEEVGSNIKLKDKPSDKDIKLHRNAVEGAREKFLIQRGYAPNVARAFSKSMGLVKTTFYTKAVEFTIDQDSGFSMSLDFINFIHVAK